MNISGATILDCDNAGLLVRNLVDSCISGCLISQANKDKPFQAIVIEGGSGNKIE